MSLYERYILPPLTHWACGTRLLRARRAQLIPAARGDVLEIGIGSGLNFDFYDATRISSLTGIDPSTALLSYARRRLKSIAFPVKLMPVSAEHIPLANASMDTVVVTFSLCTIPGVAAALDEMRRVLKPDGQLLFCEHGLSADTNVQLWQKRLDPIWGKIAGGCHLSRDIPQLLREARFRCDNLRSGYLPHAPRFASYLFQGSATVSE
jgi:ubiquinone/menaquinone biosynthesis C-methylase UbiE